VGDPRRGRRFFDNREGEFPMMHFHFNEQVVADHEARLHTRASAYRLVERVAPQSPWYRLLAGRLRRSRSGVVGRRRFAARGVVAARVADS
jgi:hypothetical protein